MPTPAERKALLFLTGLAVLGTGVRAARAYRRDSPSDAVSRTALRHQIQAVDSVRARAKPRRAGKGPVKPTGQQPRRRGQQAAATRPPERAGPQPNYVIVPRPETGEINSHSRPQLPTPHPPLPKIDLDVATAAEIERLPYIGKRLAERIVANRDSFGPFGSLEGFQRVRGIGPSLARRVQQNVTFSLTPRPFDVDEHRRKGGATRLRRSRSGGPGSP